MRKLYSGESVRLRLSSLVNPADKAVEQESPAPTGSGKSTTAQLLAEQVDTCVNIDVDLVKHFIVSGFRYEEADGVDQWRLLGKNLGMLAVNFHQENYNVIINGYLREQAWAEIEKHVNFTHTFLLMPTLVV